MNKFWSLLVLCGPFFNNVDGMANCKEIPKFWLLLLYHFKLTWFSVHQQASTFFPSIWFFFAKLIIYIFFCLVQKSVTVCFQSILLVSKRLLIILLSHSKFFIGHCTYPLFLGTFSFAASGRIYYFFAKMTLKDCQQALVSYNFLYFLLLLHQHSLEKKGCQESSWVSKHWLGKKCSQNTLWSYYSRISTILGLEALKLHKVVDSPFLKCFNGDNN